MMGMIDVSGKKIVLRTALAEGKLSLKSTTVKEIIEGTIRKGDVFTVAEIAALTGVKTTFIRIPHCHPIPVASAEVKFSIEESTIICTCWVKAEYKTGVEMEALSGVSSALLTVWDMVKYLEKDADGQYPGTKIHDVRVIEKLKGAK